MSYTVCLGWLVINHPSLCFFPFAAEKEREGDFEEEYATTEDYDYNATFDYSFFSKSFQMFDQENTLQWSQGFVVLLAFRHGIWGQIQHVVLLQIKPCSS